MTNYANKIAGIAAIALAALPLVAIAGVAQAASVKISDVDVATIEGRMEFQSRVNDAAVDYCRLHAPGAASVAARSACLDGVRAELNEKMEKVQHARTGQAQAFAAR